MGMLVLLFGTALTVAARVEPGEATVRREQATPTPGNQPAPQLATSRQETALIKQYCTGCHNERSKVVGLSLTNFDASRPETDIATAEKVIKKLRLNMMPPPGARRPDEAVLRQLATSLESAIDSAALRNPRPGWRPFPRLTREEYARSVRALLDLDIDVNAFFPPDTMSGGFDNVSDVQTFSPMLQEGYLRAAAAIAKLAVGDPEAAAFETTHKVPRTVNQMRQIDGAPWGTRGGIVVRHNFVADGEYVFRILFYGTTSGDLFGNVSSVEEQLEISIDGARVALLDIDYRMREEKDGLTITTKPIAVKAGPRTVSAAFIQTFDGVNDDLRDPIDFTLADGEYGVEVGLTALPHLRDFSISGPFRVTGISETPSRRKIFSCMPQSDSEARPCAREILTRLATQAYRRPATEKDLRALLQFFEAGAEKGGFRPGITLALQALLASPHFLFRIEELPPGATAGATYRIDDLDLATRLSYFLWSQPPDAELLRAAVAGELRNEEARERQVRRMLADPRAQSLATEFGAQYLRLQDVNQIVPDALLFAAFDHQLAESFKRETELLFKSIVQEDRSVLDLLSADYTFVNERTARVYGIPNIAGEDFQRVTLSDPDRRGILGHGSILLLTSVADRTAPVHRGKYVLEALLGSPPPPPPPNIPALEDASPTSAEGTLLSVRAKMELHRQNPQCNSCHRFIDPLGLALESFDVIGAKRIKDSGTPIDTTTTLWDGEELTGPASLRAALLRYSEPLLRNFADHLLAYALGRRVEPFDQPAVRAIVRNGAKHGHTFSAYVLGVVNSEAFQMAQVPGAIEKATQ